MGKCVFKADKCGMGSQFPTLCSCKNINTWFQPWCSTCHCKGDQYHQDEPTCCGLCLAATAMWWAHIGGTHQRLPTHHVHGCQVCVRGPPSAKTSTVVGWMERVYPKWCSAHPRIISMWQSTIPTIIASPFGAADFCNYYGCACHCSISYGGCRRGGRRQQQSGFLRILTILWIATTCLFYKTTIFCTHTITKIAWGSLPIPRICCAQRLLCTFSWLCTWNTLMGCRQQCSKPYMRGVSRICKRRFCGNQNIVQKTCVCEQNRAGHTCEDLDGRTCFGNLHLLVVWEWPLWCGLWGLIWSSNRSCWWLRIIVRHRITFSGLQNTFAAFFGQIAFRMIKRPSQICSAMRYTPPLLDVNWMCSDYRIFVLLSMLEFWACILSSKCIAMPFSFGMQVFSISWLSPTLDPPQSLDVSMPTHPAYTNIEQQLNLAQYPSNWATLHVVVMPIMILIVLKDRSLVQDLNCWLPLGVSPIYLSAHPFLKLHGYMFALCNSYLAHVGSLWAGSYLHRDPGKSMGEY